MHTENRKLKIHHAVADVSVKPIGDVSAIVLKTLIELALDSYVEAQRVSGDVIHREAQMRHGKNYKTGGHYLKVYRQRADLTQSKLADLIGIKQHHLSEMENNKRPIGKNMAQKIAKVLKMDYRKLL